LLAILPDGSWGWTTKDAYLCCSYPDVEIINRVYETEIQKVFDPLDIIMTDKVFQSKYKNSRPRIIQGWKKKRGETVLEHWKLWENEEVEKERGKFLIQSILFL